MAHAMMTGELAGRRARHVRGLCTMRLLTVAELRVYEVLIWQMRTKGAAQVMAAARAIANLSGAGAALTTVKKAIAKLTAMGLLTKLKTRVKVRWGGGVASRQGANIYGFPQFSTEVAGRPTLSRKKDSEEPEDLREAHGGRQDGGTGSQHRQKGSQAAPERMVVAARLPNLDDPAWAMTATRAQIAEEAAKIFARRQK